ncbi:ASCH domain-containing protein [uncultured Dokdonia sp.]|uniref:ASCH domain-containing protein n=1 Tax=uncultured Dokdonia sp. TaxID=575653 RepID=UPI00261893C9|nr:ASCH domain-containing protein [uncultured Dokdonia sp.]
MKYITLLLFLCYISCKNDIKTITENEIDITVYELWNSYVAANPIAKDAEMPEADYFHNTKEGANRLAALTVNGKKKASSGLYMLYQHYKVALPEVGTKQIITDFEGKAKAIIEIKRVDTIPFREISEEYASLDMGTDSEPLKKWRKAHWDFFTNVMKEQGKQPTEEMLVVCEWFETIWTEKNK